MTRGGEVVSRVQVQNIEHAVYLKLKRGLDDQIAGVVRDRYLPEIGAALEQEELRGMAIEMRLDACPGRDERVIPRPAR